MPDAGEPNKRRARQNPLCQGHHNAGCCRSHQDVRAEDDRAKTSKNPSITGVFRRQVTDYLS